MQVYSEPRMQLMDFLAILTVCRYLLFYCVEATLNQIVIVDMEMLSTVQE